MVDKLVGFRRVPLFVRTFKPKDISKMNREDVEYYATFRRIYNRYYNKLWYKNNREYQIACVNLLRKCFPKTTKAMVYFSITRQFVDSLDDNLEGRRQVHAELLRKLRVRFGRDPKTGRLKKGNNIKMSPEDREKFRQEIRALRASLGRDPETGVKPDEMEKKKLTRERNKKNRGR